MYTWEVYMLNNYTEEEMIIKTRELAEFIYRKTREEEPSDFDIFMYRLAHEYLMLKTESK